MNQLKATLRKAFKEIKTEFNEHLETINQNTNEIQSMYEYISSVENKIDKLSERIDDLQMTVNPDNTFKQFEVELTHREQETFMVLYLAENSLTATEIARRLGFSDEMVSMYTYNIITKGIPILKEFKENKTLYYLDSRFKDLQARRNIISINEGITQQLTKDKAL